MWRGQGWPEGDGIPDCFQECPNGCTFITYCGCGLGGCRCWFEKHNCDGTTQWDPPGAASAAAGMYVTPQASGSQGAALSFNAPPIPGGSTKNLVARSSVARSSLASRLPLAREVRRSGSKKNTAGSPANSEGPATTHAPWRHTVGAKSTSISPSFEHGTVVTVVTAPQIPGGSSTSAAGTLARSDGQDSRGGRSTSAAGSLARSEGQDSRGGRRLISERTLWTSRLSPNAIPAMWADQGHTTQYTVQVLSFQPMNSFGSYRCVISAPPPYQRCACEGLYRAGDLHLTGVC